MIFAVFAAVAVVLIVLTAAAVADLRRMRHVPAEPTPWQMRLFRSGPGRDDPRWEGHREDCQLTAAERIALERIAQEEAWLDLTADERQWIGDAVKGRAEGEKAPLPESED